MSLGTALGALAQLVVAGVVGKGVGDLFASRVLRDRELGWPERVLASIVGFIAFALGCMLLHLVTGGAVFGSTFAVPALFLAAVWRLRDHIRTPLGLPLGAVALAVLILGALYIAPAAIGGSSLRTGDPPWHLGWTEELLAGEPVPTGPAPEFGRNAYPWGLHAVMATMVRLVPGTTPAVALEALQVLIVLGVPLAAACLARLASARAGWGAAAATGLIGGFGWLVAGKPDFVASPTQARYGADLVVASPNSIYELLPPALPRELALIALGAAGWMLARSAVSRDRRTTIAAGVAIGIVGLISVPLFISALVWFAACTFVVERGARLKWVGRVMLPALVTFALWAAPVVVDYVRHGGFVNITPRLGVEWPLPVALASWGLLLPLAATGLWLTARTSRGRALIAFAAGTGVLLALAVARGRLGWGLAGNATLLHQGRVWPPAHLLGGAFAGMAILWAWDWLAARSRRLAVASFAVIFSIGAISPAFASIELTELIRDRVAGFEYARADIGAGSFVREAAAALDPDDVVLVEDSDELAFYLFEFSGAKLAEYDDARFEGNDLRIRFADLAAAWDLRMETLGFDPDFVVLPAPEGSVPDAVAAGEFAGRRWVMLKLSS